MDRKILTRLAKLEAENVQLQEELLRVKKQLMGVGGFVGTYDELATLREQVELAVSELALYRKGSHHVENDQTSTTVTTVHTVKVTPTALEQPKERTERAKPNMFSLDDLLN